MNTYCKIYKLKHECVDDYIRCHTEHGGEQAIVLQEAGAVSLEIYMWNDYCIITYECEDFDRLIANLNCDKRNSKWQESVDPMFEQLPVFEGDKRLKPLKKIYSTKKFERSDA